MDHDSQSKAFLCLQLLCMVFLAHIIPSLQGKGSHLLSFPVALISDGGVREGVRWE